MTDLILEQYLPERPIQICHCCLLTCQYLQRIFFFKYMKLSIFTVIAKFVSDGSDVIIVMLPLLSIGQKTKLVFSVG